MTLRRGFAAQGCCIGRGMCYQWRHVHRHRPPVFLVLWLSEANGGGAGAIFMN
jgi:hypothetical protein